MVKVILLITSVAKSASALKTILACCFSQSGSNKVYALHLTEPGKSQVLLEQKGSISGLILVIHIIINALILFLVYGVIKG